MTRSSDDTGVDRRPAEGNKDHFGRTSRLNTASTVGLPLGDRSGLAHAGSRAPSPPRLLPSPSDPPNGRSGPIRTRLGNLHPAVSVVAVILGWYLILAATLICAGMAVTHVVSHSHFGHWDEHVNDWFAAHQTTTGNRVSAWFTALANTVGVVVVAVGVTFLLLVRRWGKVALLLMIGLGVELAVFLSTTYLVARPRPSAPHLGSTPSTFSWPSGHTAATLVLYGGIALLVMHATSRRFPRIAAWTIAVALTVGVGLARIYRGEHHPTDTVAGVILGIGALYVAVSVTRGRGGTLRHSAPAEVVPATSEAPQPSLSRIS